MFLFKVRCIITFLFVSCLFSICSAQDQPEPNSRASLWRQQRVEASKNVVPYKQSKTEKLLLRVEQRGLSINYKGLYPRFGSFASGSGLAPGVRYWRPRLFGEVDFQLFAAYSTRGYQAYSVQLGKILKRGPEPFVGSAGSGGLSQFVGLERKQRNWFLYGDFRYRNYPQEDFYGLGPDTLNSDRTDYRLEDGSFDGIAGYKFKRFGVAAVRAGYVRVNVSDGTDSRFPNTQDVFDDDSAPGLQDQPDFFRASGSVFLDYRDVPGNPSSGGFVGIEYSRFDDLEDDQFDFNRFTIDARQFIPLGSKQRVLALRFLTTLDDPSEGSRVPFYLQETLGGGDILRGFREFRFRDVNLLALSAEYRWEAAPAWELALFYDTGKVFNDRSEFNFDQLEDSYGFGIRFKLPETGTFLRFDTARSNEGTRFYFKYAAAF